jgi:tRNA A37 threonylcarbamoyladenosine dehydratase
MINEFSRTELLIGQDSMERLKSTTVMVFGVGGVGSHCIDALARGGIGKLILIDHDKVSLTASVWQTTAPLEITRRRP